MRIFAFIFLLNASLYATLPDDSKCQFSMSNHAKGRIYSPGLAGMGLIMPEEMVRVISASCINSKTGKEVIVTARQTAFYEDNKLISNPEYGIFAPSYSIEYVNASDGISEGKNSTYVLKNSLEEHSLKIKILIARDAHNKIQALTFKMTQKMPMTKGLQMPGVRLLNPGKKLKIKSWGEASQFIDQGTKSWGEIREHIRSNKWNLPRQTRRLES